MAVQMPMTVRARGKLAIGWKDSNKWRRVLEWNALWATSNWNVCWV